MQKQEKFVKFKSEVNKGLIKATEVLYLIRNLPLRVSLVI